MSFNNYNRATFMLGVASLQQLPADQGAEVAFAGRSNVGKSSVINAVTGHNKLARTSKTPGRTRELNYFSLDENRRLVDLPGYGFSRVSTSMQLHWGKMLEDYFRNRRSLAGLILIMDIRHPLKPFDLQMLEWCEVNRLPIHILLNKADKLSKSAAFKAEQGVKKVINPENSSVQLFSVLRRSGADSVRQKLDTWLNW